MVEDLDKINIIALDPALKTDVKVERIVSILHDLLSSLDVDRLNKFISIVIEKIGESSPVTRPILSNYVDAIGELDENHVLEQLCKHVLPLIRDKMTHYAEDVLRVSMYLSEVHQANEDFVEAARALSSIELDGPGRQPNMPRYKASMKVDVLLRISELFLAENDFVSAGRYVNRAHRLINQVDDLKLSIRHKSIYAQVLDFERRFLDASIRYLSLAQIDTHGIISEDDQLTALTHAVTCALLAAAGPSKSRVLAMLYSDPRSQALPNFKMLENMFKERIIQGGDQANFQRLIRPHQNADLPDGTTVLSRAINEHNMLAASRLFSTVGFDDLSSLLGVSAEHAESIACKMIKEKRLVGFIDQVTGLVTFEINPLLLVWDAQIQTFCSLANDVVDRIADQYPQFAV